MKNQRKKKRIIFVGSVFLISLLALIFVILNFRDNIVFFYAPSELKTTEILQKTADKKIRIGGLVKQSSVRKIDATTTQFTVTDYEQDLIVNYFGLLPDLFREGQGVVAKGKFDIEKNQFFSSELLVKHDEKYMPPEVKKSLKKTLN
ncbi:MAG: cytochrome c maturation protein CcmE [Proteobacteria bacterium]|nr:cytochrome c maturation protein CcmE [Pseudomonadota bacterium]